MSTASVGNISSYLQSLLASALQATGATSNPGNNAKSAQISSAAPPKDSSQLSPFAQLLNTLQQLQQSDPTKYRQVTQDIATNLNSAAQTAQSDGNTAAANKLSQLAKDFSDASTSGQLPNIQDLARAIGGGHHHHSRPASDSDSDSSSPSQQALAAFQSNSTQAASVNPAAIILDTLSKAGISLSNG